MNEYAFPGEKNTTNKSTLNSGMTLRDYFAAKAMQAYVQNNYRMDLKDEDIAIYAYQIADAMMKEREK